MPPTSCRHLLRRYIGSCRFLSSRNPDESSSIHTFDRSLKRLQRDNAARAHRQWRSGVEAQPVSYDYIQQELAHRLVDRLDDIKHSADGFPLALNFGSGAGHIYRAICADDAILGSGGIGGVRKLVQLDSSELLLSRDVSSDTYEGEEVEGSDRCDTYRLVHDEESPLPFPDGTFDLVISSGTMHWVNDLPQAFSEIRRVLKPNGCFLLAIVGGTSTTLAELRASMVLAEMERDGGVSPHVGPFVEISDVGALLQRAGFTLPTVDTDTVQLSFPNAAVLMEHLQRMGESNASRKRRDRTPLDTFLATACIYDSLFPVTEQEGDIEASVQVIYAIGWTPHESQQKPLERGSATLKVGDMVEHHPTKD